MTSPAEAAARRAGVVVRVAESAEDLQGVSALLASVWGTTDEGVPVPTEVMRSLAHAGGCTTAAFDQDGSVAAAASLAVAAPAGSTYSLIAAAAPGLGDRGLGHAVKLHQREWALAHGFTTMRWTFDPLVGRNARFNLVKLGAVAGTYAVDFYRGMTDGINAGDESDRLVATWALDSPRVGRALAGILDEPEEPPTGARPGRDAPDGHPLRLASAQDRWVRVPRDIVALRGADPGLALAWRRAVREVMVEAIDDGLVGVHLTRSGWYRFAPTPDGDLR